MRAIGSVLFSIAACLSAPAAWAANAADLTVTVVARPSDPAEVSVSRSGLDSNVSYRVTLLNSSNNTVNQVVFTGTTTVTPTPITNESGVASYVAFSNLGSASPNCALPSNPIDPAVHSVICQIGQLKSQQSRDFFLIFRAPQAGANIVFQAHTAFSEGNSSNTPPANFTKDVIPPPTIELITTQTAEVNKSVHTVLPPAGGLFFTGPNGQVGANNPWSTSVGVPATTLVTTNQIVQPDAVPSSACSLDFPGYFCFGLGSRIDVRKALDDTKLILAPGAAALTITLRQDASSLAVFKPTPAVTDVKIFYNPDSTSSVTGSIVPPCTASGPAPDQPCVSARRNFVKGNKGYYEYEIKAKDNGVFSW